MPKNNAPAPLRKMPILRLSLSLALTVAPHMSNLLPSSISGYFLFILGWRGIGLRYPRLLPGKWLTVVLVGIGLCLVLAQYHTVFGRTAGISLLTVMLGLKLLELRQARDFFVAVFLGYFLIITHFLTEQNLFTALYMLMVVVLLTTSMIDLNHPEASLPWPRKMRLSLLLLVQALPLMILFFLFFPRASAPLWSLPGDAQAITGLSNEMSPGAFSELNSNNAVAFRVDFEGEPPPPTERYWRGPVFWYTDGVRWRYLKNRKEVRHPVSPALFVPPDHPPLRYTITLEPHGRRWLFALDLPSPKGLEIGKLNYDFQYIKRDKIKDRLRYSVQSYTTYYTGLLADFERKQALQLPEKESRRVRQLVQSWRAQTNNPQEIVQQALEHFRSQGFVYTLTPPKVSDPIDGFLFVSKQGFCEHYASAFTYLMRMAGVPARVVTGYLGGEYNPIGNYWSVRQTHAHAWSEVWLVEKGWVRVDPTTVISPQRVENVIDKDNPGTYTNRRFSGNALLAEFRQAFWYRWDAMNHHWNQRVLGYDSKRQQSFLQQLGIATPRWQNMLALLGIGTVFIVVILGLLIVVQRAPSPADPVQKIYQKFCQRLQRQGLPRKSHEGPLDYAARVSQHFPLVAAQAQLITRLYIQLRYARTANQAKQQAQLRRVVKQFRPRKAKERKTT